MQRSKVTLKVLSPGGKTVEMTEQSVWRRLSDLSGKKIGVITNTKSGGETLLPYLPDALKRRSQSIQLRTWKVTTTLSPDLKESRLREIVEHSEGVIALMDD